jgi:acyl-CoA synthetase (AMP-forming)/AMP-acid ligase II
VIVKKEGMDVDEDEIRNFCRQEIAGYKIPKSVIFVNELPTSATGKLLKGQLRKKIGLEALAASLPRDHV